MIGRDEHKHQVKKERNLWFVITFLMAVLPNSLIAQDREENVRFEKDTLLLNLKTV